MSFASTDDLAILVGHPIDEDKGQLLLDMATAAIQSAAGQQLEAGNSTVTLMGCWGEFLELPEQPVVTVNSVDVNGISLGVNDWTANALGLWRQIGIFASQIVNGPDLPTPRQGAQYVSARTWGGPASHVTVDYDHGYDPIPNDLRGICLELALGAYQAPGLGITGETIAGYSYTQAAGATSSMALSPAHIEIIDSRYRRKFAAVPMQA